LTVRLIRIESSLHKKLKLAATKKEVTLQALIEQIVKEYLEG